MPVTSRAFVNQTLELHFRESELSMLLEMLADFDKVARENGVGYFLWGGTLLGAYRNGTILVRPLAPMYTVLLCCR